MVDLLMVLSRQVNTLFIFLFLNSASNAMGNY